MWLVVGVAFSAVLAAFSWSVAFYASANTPEIHEVVVKAANGGQSIQSKTTFLFVQPVFQTFAFLMLLNPLIRWKYFVRKAAEKASPKDLWTEPTMGRYNFATLVRGMTIALCIANGIGVYWVVENAGYLLGK